MEIHFGDCNKEYKICALKCQNGKHFFRVPSTPKTRKLWLDKLGLDFLGSNSRICNNHFSDKMLTVSGKRLTRTAVPDRNIPSTNGGYDLDEDSSVQLTWMIDNLLSKGDLPDKPTASRNAEQNDSIQSGDKTNTTVQGLSAVDKHNRTTNKSISKDQNDSKAECAAKPLQPNPSNLLLNYQLQKHGKHICNVTEIPEFILVFNAFRAWDTVITPPNDLVTEHIQMSHNVVASNNEVASKDKETSTTNETVKPTNSTREIKYVRYTPEKNVIRRERGIQVVNSAQTNTTEIALQCDLDEERTNDSSQLEWINHIIEAHVISAEGDMYECHICGEIAASYASNLKHSMIHKERSSLCSQCGRLFANHVKLKNHEKRVHMERKLEIKKAMRCPKMHCTKAFHSKRQLFDHIDQHTKKTVQRCSKCQRSFSSSLQFLCHKSRRNCLR